MYGPIRLHCVQYYFLLFFISKKTRPLHSYFLGKMISHVKPTCLLNGQLLRLKCVYIYRRIVSFLYEELDYHVWCLVKQCIDLGLV